VTVGRSVAVVRQDSCGPDDTKYRKGFVCHDTVEPLPRPDLLRVQSRQRASGSSSVTSFCAYGTIGGLKRARLLAATATFIAISGSPASSFCIWL
jgi:hypothetical protein